MPYEKKFDFGSPEHIEACRIHARKRMWQRYGVNGHVAQNAMYDNHTRLIKGEASGLQCVPFVQLDNDVIYMIDNLIDGHMFPVFSKQLGVIRTYLSPAMAHRSRASESKQTTA